MALLLGMSHALTAQETASVNGVRLKLDWDMMPLSSAGQVDRSKMLAAEPPALRSRLLKAKDRVAALDEANAEKSQRLTRHEELIARMQGVVEAQERIIARLEDQANQARSGDAARARPIQPLTAVQSGSQGPAPVTPASPIQPTVVAQAPVSRSVPAAPVPAPRTLSPTTTAPQGPAAGPGRGDIHIGPVVLPGQLRNYYREGAMGLAAVLLLGWFVVRWRARPRVVGDIASAEGPPADADAEIEDTIEDTLDTEAPEPPDASRAPARRAPAAAGDPTPAPTPDLKNTAGRRSSADPDVLQQVDTLIARDDLPAARRMLNANLKGNEGNPEYRLRLLHIDAIMGDDAKAAQEQEILAEMNRGPLSDSVNRVKEIGRGLMPGHPLFDDAEKLNEAKRIIHAHESKDRETPAAKATDRQAKPGMPPLILELEADDETIDFLTEIYPEGGDDQGKEKAG